jgi:DHA1 family multidrug resistance protein-like MFS transporter
VGPLIGGILSEITGYGGVFVLTGTLILLAGLVVMIFVKQTVPKQLGQGTTIVKPKRNWKSLRMLFPVFLATTITQMAMMSIQPILPIYQSLRKSTPTSSMS